MLYKVTAPREDQKFFPSKFWRTENWDSSSNRPRENYIEDLVLYAGDFDEVNIHLLPRVRRLRFWSNETNKALLHDFSLAFTDASNAAIVADSGHEDLVLSFSPTVYTFMKDGFENVRNGEYVSRTPRTAVGCEKLPFVDAIRRWQFTMIFTKRYEENAEAARARKIYFDEQS